MEVMRMHFKCLSAQPKTEECNGARRMWAFSVVGGLDFRRVGRNILASPQFDLHQFIRSCWMKRDALIGWRWKREFTCKFVCATSLLCFHKCFRLVLKHTCFMPCWLQDKLNSSHSCQPLDFLSFFLLVCFKWLSLKPEVVKTMTNPLHLRSCHFRPHWLLHKETNYATFFSNYIPTIICHLQRK